MIEKKKIIISQPWGGLGDNLQFSTLPKLYNDLGYDVYISKSNVYRNKEIFDLVWKLNPYIKGEIDLPENAGSCKGYTVYEDNFIKNIELSHDLKNGNNKYPEIYYQPNKLSDYKNILIYDITSISAKYDDEFIIKCFKSVFDKYPNLDKKIVKFKNINNRNLLFNDNIIEINNIFEYCDIINSCAVFVSLMSGCSVLASAIKKDNLFPEIYTFHHTPLLTVGSIYKFKNINWNYSPI